LISSRLLSLVRCPDCRGHLASSGDQLGCAGCGRRFPLSEGFLDLRPTDGYSEQTKYLDGALHADARHETLSPPLLGARVRNDMLRSMLAPGPADIVIDLGCGSGRTLLWNEESGAAMTGLDVSPFFAADALARVDLVLGDLRRLPFGDGVFTKGFALDVMEHLSREALADVLRESSRVLAPQGVLFVYSHVRKNAPLAVGLRLVNRLAHALERWGWLDLRQERLRKSDHLNPLADIPDLERTVGAAGFRIDRIRYYTPVIGGFVENIVVRLAEQALGRRAARRAARDRTAVSHGLARSDAGGADVVRAVAAGGDRAETARLARAEAKRRIAGRGPTYRALLALTWLMKSDVWLFGRVRSGPFFARLVKN